MIYRHASFSFRSQYNYGKTVSEEAQLVDFLNKNQIPPEDIISIYHTDDLQCITLIWLDRSDSNS